MNIISAYSEKTRVITVNKEPSMTKQSLAEDLDVNKIIKKYNVTGILQKATDFEMNYGDFTGADFNKAMNTVADANSLFEQVPSEIRAQFQNQPGAFIDFATNPENHLQMAKWGLANPKTVAPEVPPVVAEATPPTPEPPIVPPTE